MPEAPDLHTVWSTLVGALPAQHRAWLSTSQPVTLHENTAIVAVPNDFTRGQLETRLRAGLEQSLSDALGRPVHLAVTVDRTLLDEPAEPPTPVPTESQAAPVTESEPDAPPQTAVPATHGFDTTTVPINHTPDQGLLFDQAPAVAGSVRPKSPGQAMSAADTRLNRKYLFDTFVMGASNRFAHAAAVAVAESPGKAYNPLLIYGDSGLGKTHLLHAIGHYVCSLYDGARVRYVSSEEFTNDFINAIHAGERDQLQKRYRDVDVLLIDDIQFIEGKPGTQEEFFHTFNALHNANKQIVLTSDRPPKMIEQLEDRLRNRFEWGLITDVQPPDLETRIAILRKKAATERMTAPPDVLDFIASKIQTNIRELEGALIRVTAFAQLNKQPVDMSLAEIVLKDLIPAYDEPEITSGLIIAQTASYFQLSIDDLCGPSRSRVLVTARQIAMYLCRELTDMSLPDIGRTFGGRDHTTVMHANRKIKQQMAEKATIFDQIRELTSRIKQQARQQ